MSHTKERPIRRVLMRLARQIGRRGASLAFVGMVSGILSLSVATPPPEVRNAPGYLLLASILPLAAWCALWGATSVLCLVQVFVRSDRLAFTVATAMMSTWGVLYCYGAITGAIPRGWVAGAVWGGFAGWLTLISTWPEAVDLPAVQRREEGTDA